jgi:protein-L-isoaspartate(D-aspartate) O-methyltransferase
VCAGRSSLTALDVGCGSGLLAVALAELGCAVTAVDLSERALAMGRAREGGERVRWLCADVMSATLAGRFDLVCDRALLHVLPQGAQRAYAQRAARWLVEGGAMVLTAHSEEAPSELGTTRFTVRTVAELFDGLLEIESVERCVMRGPAGQRVSARRYVLRKG